MRPLGISVQVLRQKKDGVKSLCGCTPLLSPFFQGACWLK